MVNRGADMSWLSQYPHEKEILFGPLTGIEVLDTRINGSVVEIICDFSVNLTALTLEQVLNKRQKLLKDMGEGMVLEVRTALAGTGVEARQAAKLRDDLAAEVLHVVPEAFNEDACFAGAVEKALQLKQEAAGAGALRELRQGGMTCVEAKAKVGSASGVDAKAAGYSWQEVKEAYPLQDFQEHPAVRKLLYKVGDTLEEAVNKKELHWQGKGLYDEDAEAVAIVVAFSAVLTELRLHTNKFGDAGATAIAEALKVNAVITTLFLPENKIGDAGASAIADALRVNAVITTLYLSFNQIGDTGASAIADALRVNAVLTTLELGANKIGVAGATAIADALRVNAVLTTLAIANNNFNQNSKSKLQDAVKGRQGFSLYA